MSQVARVFVVLNLLLAVGFLFAASTFLAMNNDYKVKLQKEVDGRVADNKAKDSEISQLKGQITNLEGLNRTLSEQKSNLEGSFTGVQATVSSLESENKNKDSLLAQSQRNINEAAVATQALNSDKNRLTEALNAAHAEAREKTAEAMKALADLTAANEEIVSLKNEVAANEASIATLKTKVTDQNMMLEYAAGKGIDFSTLVLTPPLNGQVVSANADIAMLNLGSNAGVKLGYVFDIVRGGSYVGRIVIDQVYANNSAGKITIRSKTGSTPQPGDRATTALN
ncbi:MAG TPA: hypothetical protein PKA37_01790 [Planctomycetota bacterium]|mgnify:CR=1 FL=1|jgi:predicted  nucleic acid-binding Zn-ribbon protein|nr:hypothetical protein [Planctomycetota bacterium]